MKSPFFMTRSVGLRWIAAAGLVLGTLSADASDAPDLDGDGIPNIVDPDIDNDGIPNALDDNIDGGIARSGPFTGQYLGDHINNDNPAERDIDDDGLADDSLGETDIDGDAKTDDDVLETDIDGDRRADDFPSELDIDGDGRKDDALNEDDIDGDSLDDDDLMEDDIDGDALEDIGDDDIDGDDRLNSGDIDDDTDGDGRINGDDRDDSDGDGLQNREDDDDDNDGVTDEDDADHHDESDEVEVHADLDPTVNAPNGSRVRVVVQRMATGKIEMKVSGRDFAPGTYDVIVDGQVIGQLLMEGDGEESEGDLEFETNAGDGDELELPFDPIGLSMTISQGGADFFTGGVPVPPDAPVDGEGDDGGGADGQASTFVLEIGTGLGPEANAEGEIEFGPAGVISLAIEVASIPEGGYEVFIGGISRALMAVVGNGGGTVGSVRFRVVPEDDGDLALAFPVSGEEIVVMRGQQVIFSGTAPSAP